ncbi:helix-turn-helix transcriptional regulator [Loigolactobacillus coryniformis]|uniref:Helix-turn-helix transcriptional regulator n=1 Tax=Loigolactobacillus coryniformis TaxID=1610 RepID=A0A5B8TPN9_9LACO|nr:helix-turn-helix transcriptional regulator [Loigolactobacillus coryniformis]RRG02917.1 MAG: transcriptional regulator [Lactobacillus sp.]
MPNKVRQFRLEQHLSQKEVAEKVGITRQTLSLIEKFAYNPSLKLCLNICYVLGRTLDEVFWEERK